MITIKAEKVINKGKQELKITKIKALHFDELPHRYTNGYKEKKLYVCLYGNNSLLLNDPAKTFDYFSLYVFQVGQTYSREYFEKAIKLIRQAGDRLRRINKELAEQNKNWNGITEIKI